MPLLSFSGETYNGPFWKQILDGKKTQTCRQPRKRPIKKTDKLRLYWKVRMRKDWKPIHFIADAICTKVQRLEYWDFAFDEEFARRDGFYNCIELWDWFGHPLTDRCLDDEYDVIHFKLVKV